VRVASCLVVAAVALSGCSEKQEAGNTLPLASSSAPAETTTELPPLGPEDMPMPAEARTQDAAGAEAFVRYYIDLINRTSDVMDAKPLRDLSDNCRDCTRIASSTEKAAAAGQDYQGGEMTIIEIGPAVLKETAADLPIVVDQAKFIVTDASGAPTHGGSDAYAHVTGGVALTWDSGRETWLMSDLTFG
jgi:hypothetical protein